MCVRIVATAITAMFLMAPAAHAQTTERAGEGVPASIRYYESVAMMSSSAAASQGVGAVGVDTMDVSFYTLGREFDLKLEKHDPFAPGALVRWVGKTGTMKEPGQHDIFWRGRDERDPSSWVRLTLRGNALAGIVSTEGELYFLEPASRFFGPEAAGETLAYRLSDTDTSGMIGGCAARHRVPQRYRSAAQARAAHRALRELIGRAAEVQLAAAAGLKEADIGMVADYLYYNTHLADSAADLAEVVNNVDGIYQSEIGVMVRIKAMTIFTSDAADPFSATNVPITLLDELGAWRDANDDDPSQPMWDTDLTHLFTGRDMQSNVIGIAYIGALCNSSTGVGVDQDYTTALNLLTLMLAHEMGHNFGAPHDNQTGSACASEPGVYIMNPSIDPSLQQKFSPCSKSFINPKVASAGCLSDAGPTFTPTNTPVPTATPTPTMGVPAITDPSAGQVIGVEGVTFTWNPVSGATGYDLRIVNGVGATVFTGTLGGGSSTTTLIGLPSNGTYTFRVRACVGAISDSTCGVFASRNFTVSLAGPTAAPTITSPAPNDAFSTSQHTLQWTTVAGNPSLPDLFYEVVLTNRSTGQTELNLRTRHPTAQTAVTLRSVAYRMQVRACQAACGPFSAPVDFSVALGAVPATAPSITSAVVNGGNSLTASWTAVSGAEWYQVQVIQPRPAGPGGGALTVAARQVSATSVTLPVPAGQASVIVAACNGDGCGPYTPATGISPTGPNPSAPQMGSPLDGSVVNGPTVLFTWTRVPGDTGNTMYRLYVQDVSRSRAALDIYTTQNFYAALLKAEGGKYAVQAIANPGTASQVNGPPVTFTVRGASGVAPTLMAPTNASVLKAGNVLVGWTPVPGATLYEYLLTVQGAGVASGRGVTPGIFVQVPVSAVNGQPTNYIGIVRACPAGQTCAPGSDAGWGPWSSEAGSGGIGFTIVP